MVCNLSQLTMESSQSRSTYEGLAFSRSSQRSSMSSLSLPLRRSYASSKLVRSRDLQLFGAQPVTWGKARHVASDCLLEGYGPLSHTTAVAVLRQSHPLMRHHAKLIFERGWSSRFPSYTVTSPASGNYSVLQKENAVFVAFSVQKSISPDDRSGLWRT
jgi:hypothetical protein